MTKFQQDEEIAPTISISKRTPERETKSSRTFPLIISIAVFGFLVAIIRTTQYSIVEIVPTYKALPKLSVFAQKLQSHPWDKHQKAFDQGGNQLKKYNEKLLNTLSELMIIEPLVPINESCLPPPLSNPPNCAAYPTIFNSTPLSTSRKVAIVVTFSFEVDTLEIILQQYYDVVDNIVIQEATYSNKGMKKFLMWEEIRETQRFSKFNDKVLHWIIDDSYMHDRKEGEDIWIFENVQIKEWWKKFKNWNNIQKKFSDLDIIGLADLDEIPDRENFHLLKNCELLDPMKSIDIAVWFAFGDVRTAFRTDWPAGGYAYSLACPTFYSFKHAYSIDCPYRTRGRGPLFMKGGAHFTSYSYAPAMFLKQMSVTEYGMGADLISKMSGLLKNTTSLIEFEKYWFDSMRSVHEKAFPGRFLPINEFPADHDGIKKAPWFYTCNSDRFPAWTLDHDTRLEFYSS